MLKTRGSVCLIPQDYSVILSGVLSTDYYELEGNMLTQRHRKQSAFKSLSEQFAHATLTLTVFVNKEPTVNPKLHFGELCSNLKWVT